MVTSSPITNKIEIVGIVSWGRGCAMPNSPGSYTNVRMYKSFIEKTIKPGECIKLGVQGLRSRSQVEAPVNTTAGLQAKVKKIGGTLLYFSI